MNKTTIRIYCAVLFCLGVIAISCGGNMNGAEAKERAKMIAMKDSTCSESLLFWTADTVWKTDSEQVLSEPVFSQDGIFLKDDEELPFLIKQTVKKLYI